MRKLYIISAYATASFDLNIDNLVVNKKNEVISTIEESIESFEEKYTISKMLIHFRLDPIITNPKVVDFISGDEIVITEPNLQRFIIDGHKWYVEKEFLTSKMRTTILSKIDRLEKERTLTNHKLNDLYDIIYELKKRLEE